jgi:hypothetical protein
MARQTLTAVIEAVNERGVRINGTWHNFSSYAANGAIDRTVQAGDTAEIELTGTGWVRKLSIVQRAQTQQPAQAAQQPTNGVGARALDAAQYTRLRAVVPHELGLTFSGQLNDEVTGSATFILGNYLPYVGGSGLKS